MSEGGGEPGLLRGVLAAARAVRAANRGIAAAMGGLAIAMVVVFLAVVILRYGFGIGLIWLQESAQYLHAAIFRWPLPAPSSRMRMCASTSFARA